MNAALQGLGTGADDAGVDVVGAAHGATVHDAVAEDWNEFVRRASAAELYHDYRWRSLFAHVFGHETHYLMARGADGRVSGVLPLVRLKSRLFGDFLVSVPYFNYGGLLTESQAATDALLAEAEHRARAAGVEHIELRHREGVELGLPRRDDKVTMLLDLPQTEEALWDSFKPKLRSQIRRPQKEGASVLQGGIELLGDFYAVFARNMRDLGTPVYPKRFFAAVMESFAEDARLFVVYVDGKATAVGLTLAHRSTVEIPWASSLQEANRLGVNMLLYWSVLRYSVERGVRQFDFGRSTKDSGTYRFKEQWGARPQQLYWYYWLREGLPLPRLTPSNPKYKAFIAMWRRLPVPVANILGPHLVKNLP